MKNIDPQRMIQPITTTRGIILESDFSHEMYTLNAISGGYIVGHLVAMMQPDSVVLINDIVVKNTVVTSRIPFRRFLSKCWPQVGMTSFRGQGIGTRMLVSFLGWCSLNGKVEAYGTLVQKDLDETPGLLDWYRRHGFEVRPLDGRCLRNAIQMVVWRNDEPQSAGGSESYGNL